MADATAAFTPHRMTPQLGVTSVVLWSDETPDDTDTISVTLADYGISTLLGIIGFIHTTKDSVIVQEQPTTSVTTGTLTITVGGATDNKKRCYILYGI